MTNIRSLVDNITASDNVSAQEKIADIMAEKLQTLLDLAKIEVAQGMFNTCEECSQETITQEQYDALSEAEQADFELIDEALMGNQTKLDANKNGKLDAQDFKMLRAKKKGMKEEAEQIDEISQKTKDSYVAKRGSQLSSMMHGSSKNYSLLSGKKQAKAVKGIKQALNKEEVAQEAYTDPYAAKKSAEMKKNKEKLMADAKKEFDAAKKTKFAKNFMKMKEEAEQIDEVSSETLKSYQQKSMDQGTRVMKKQEAPLSSKKFANRVKGNARASEILNKREPAKTNSFNFKDMNSERAAKFKAKQWDESVKIDEVITKKTPTGEVISDFVHSKNPKFAGKSKKERIRMALGAKYAMMKKGK
jgi:hypothetical protein